MVLHCQVCFQVSLNAVSEGEHTKDVVLAGLNAYLLMNNRFAKVYSMANLTGIKKKTLDYKPT